MLLIIGTRLFTWGCMPAAQAIRCGKCGAVAYFLEKTAIRFVTIFFFIPIIPISGMMKLIECPRCSTRFKVAQAVAATSASA